jgi:hypothetical protein
VRASFPGSGLYLGGCEPVWPGRNPGDEQFWQRQSGNSATLPVVIFAEEKGKSEEELARALILSHLTAIYIKNHMGRLAAFCGCVVAATGSSCGITRLMGGGYLQITYAVKNMIANLTGMVCDGAKPSCSLKVTSGVSTAVFSAMMAMENHYVTSLEGIIEEDPEPLHPESGLRGLPRHGGNRQAGPPHHDSQGAASGIGEMLPEKAAPFLFFFQLQLVKIAFIETGGYFYAGKIDHGEEITGILSQVIFQDDQGHRQNDSHSSSRPPLTLSRVRKEQAS